MESNRSLDHQFQATSSDSTEGKPIQKSPIPSAVKIRLSKSVLLACRELSSPNLGVNTPESNSLSSKNHDSPKHSILELVQRKENSPSVMKARNGPSSRNNGPFVNGGGTLKTNSTVTPTKLPESPSNNNNTNGRTTTNSSSTKKKKSQLTYFEMIYQAILTMKDRQGSSLPAIKKYVEKTYGSTIPNFDLFLTRVNTILRKAVKDQRFVKVGARYKISPKEKEKRKRAKRQQLKKARNAQNKSAMLRLANAKQRKLLAERKERKKKLEEEKRRRQREKERLKREKEREKMLREKYPIDDLRAWRKIVMVTSLASSKETGGAISTTTKTSLKNKRSSTGSPMKSGNTHSNRQHEKFPMTRIITISSEPTRLEKTKRRLFNKASSETISSSIDMMIPSSTSMNPSSISMNPSLTDMIPSPYFGDILTTYHFLTTFYKVLRPFAAISSTKNHNSYESSSYSKEQQQKKRRRLGNQSNGNQSYEEEQKKSTVGPSFRSNRRNDPPCNRRNDPPFTFEELEIGINQMQTLGWTPLLQDILFTLLRALLIHLAGLESDPLFTTTNGVGGKSSNKNSLSVSLTDSTGRSTGGSMGGRNTESSLSSSAGNRTPKEEEQEFETASSSAAGGPNICSLNSMTNGHHQQQNGAEERREGERAEGNRHNILGNRHNSLLQTIYDNWEWMRIQKQDNNVYPNYEEEINRYDEAFFKMGLILLDKLELNENDLNAEVINNNLLNNKVNAKEVVNTTIPNTHEESTNMQVLISLIQHLFEICSRRHQCSGKQKVPLITIRRGGQDGGEVDVDAERELELRARDRQ
eukprot:g3503.t1